MIDDEVLKLPRYELTTSEVSVTVEPYFIEEQSEPESDQYFWGYRVEIANNRAESIQLIGRFWRITDSRGYSQEVRGAGVVGEKPVLQPGQSFEYTSGAPLSSPSGVMVGHYQMRTESGQPLVVSIPAFSLDSPHELSRPN